MRTRSVVLHSLMIATVINCGFAAVKAQSPAGVRETAIAAVDRKIEKKLSESNVIAVSTAETATHRYTIGANDLLRIELKDVPGVPRSVRVQPDGTIAYPLVDLGMKISGMTLADAEALISRSVRTLSKGGVHIQVAEYLSHTVTICGLVGDPGEQQIQRDAIPFFVIRAMSSIDPRADAVQIVRSGSSKVENHRLSEAMLDTLLIYPGDSVEFGRGTIRGNVN